MICPLLVYVLAVTLNFTISIKKKKIPTTIFSPIIGKFVVTHCLIWWINSKRKIQKMLVFIAYWRTQSILVQNILHQDQQGHSKVRMWNSCSTSKNIALNRLHFRKWKKMIYKLRFKKQSDIFDRGMVNLQ